MYKPDDDYAFLENLRSHVPNQQIDNIIDINLLYSKEVSNYFKQKTLDNPLLRRHNTLVSSANYLLFVMNNAIQNTTISLCNQNGTVLICNKNPQKVGTMCYLAMSERLIFFTKLREGHHVCTQITGDSPELGKTNIDAYVIAYPILDSKNQFIGYITGEIAHQSEIAECSSLISFLAMTISVNIANIDKQIAFRTLIMNNVPTCSIVMDISGSVFECNTAFSQFLDTNDLDLSTVNFLDLMGDKSLIVSAMNKDPLAAADKGTGEFQLIVADGVYQCRMLTCTDLTENYGQPGWFLSFGLLSYVPYKSDGTISFASMESHFGHLHSRYEHFNDILNQCEQIAPKKINILIQGESGTGKDVLARAIHQASRVTGPFVALNCGAIDPNLLISELFGYDEGAFTGAKKGGKIGKLEAADHGTIFLDEIGEMPLESQVSLLKFLDNQIIVKLGGTKQYPVDVRIIAATNRDLAKEVSEGRFREDLYYRLNVMDINLPPLRERVDDIPDLCSNILLDISNKYNHDQPIALDKNCEYLLKQYDWPGNIRELKNILELSFALSDEASISFAALQKVMYKKCFKANAPHKSNAVEQKDILHMSLVKYNGNISAVAKELGMSRTTVYKKIKEYGLR
jgi:transcriptional regulator with PAS, ATPase and Fis domain